MTNIYAALEIGTTRTVLAVGEAKSGGRVKVVAHAEIPSADIRKSQILDIKSVAQSIKSVLKKIETSQNKDTVQIDIGNAFLVVSGDYVKADILTGHIEVESGKVSQRDMEELTQTTREMCAQKDREVLDVIDLSYTLDRIGGIANPCDMSGRMLSLDTLRVSADANRINDARTAANEAHLELRDPLFAAMCAADSTLDETEKRNGALVLDLGGGSTGYAAYINGYPVAASAIAIGGDHISSDISYAFQTTHAVAEELKKREASAILATSKDLSPRVQLGSSPLIETRTISRRALNTVVNLRVKELLGFIRRELENSDLLRQLHAGIVLTGGGAALSGLDALVQKEFGLPVRFGKPIHVDGLSEAENPESFAAIAGALMFAHKHYERKPLFSIFKGLFK